MKFRLPRSKEPLQKALKLRGYSRKTIKAYCNQVERFLSSLSLKNKDVTTSNVQMYCLGLLERGISHSSVNQTISALRFYCKHGERFFQASPGIGCRNT
ncbi:MULTISPECIES: phage integrase N-terminal SAM-like domain-containing protein [unclassified Paenibacillus]|uniref:phage integrase N-terminal SAM-like domain-containing protein n=1 Tax=unclassified Paenibacillus TaxID=185978 RepID=UPI00122E4FA5|nr:MULTISPECIES: phage integrase N-terminal SAM-like domain-containing protein [unclassified Paenibacillus]